MNWTSNAHIRDQVQMPGGSSLIQIQFNPSSSSVCVCVCVCVCVGGRVGDRGSAEKEIEAESS